MFEIVTHEGATIAILVRRGPIGQGISFVDEESYPLQLGLLGMTENQEIQPHFHVDVPRQVVHTQEVLIIKKGRLRVDFFDNAENYLHSRILEAGDVILLVDGGHGFQALDDVEVVEVKTGPYNGLKEKRRFDTKVSEEEYRIIPVPDADA